MDSERVKLGYELCLDMAANGAAFNEYFALLTNFEEAEMYEECEGIRLFLLSIEKRINLNVKKKLDDLSGRKNEGNITSRWE